MGKVMTNFFSRLIGVLAVSSTMLAISNASAGVNELPADIQNSLYNKDFRPSSANR